MNYRTSLACVASLALVAACGQRSEEAAEPAAEPAPAETSPAAPGSMVLPATTSSPEALALYLDGWKTWDVGRFVDAHKQFVAAGEADPSFAMAHLMAAISAQSTESFVGKLRTASETAAEASAGEQLMIRSIERAFAGDQVGQIAALEELTAVHPDSPRAWSFLGFSQGQINNTAASREALYKASELDPTMVGPHFTLANNYMFLEPKDLAKAEKHAMKAVELASDEPNPYDLLGDVHRSQGNLEAAYDDYTKAAELAPAMGSPLQQRGHVNSFLGNYDEARADYTKSAELEDARGTNTGPFFLVFRAYVDIHAGNPDAAIAELRSLADAAADSDMEGAADFRVNALSSAALIAIHYGNADAASAAIEDMAAVMRAQADEVGTDEYRDAQEATIAYNEGLLAARMGDAETAAAKAAAFEGFAASSQNPRKLERMHEILGMSAYYQGDHEGAVEHLSKGDPQGTMYTKYYLALAHESLGNSEEAARMFNELAVWNFNGPGYALIRGDVLAKVSQG
jgi:tetratricopeptide (TPR) repeat protein